MINLNEKLSIEILVGNKKFYIDKTSSEEFPIRIYCSQTERLKPGNLGINFMLIGSEEVKDAKQSSGRG